jgi:hypothetical protein
VDPYRVIVSNQSHQLMLMHGHVYVPSMLSFGLCEALLVVARGRLPPLGDVHQPAGRRIMPDDSRDGTLFDGVEAS